MASRWSGILFYWVWYLFYEIVCYWKFASILFYCNFSFWNYLLCKVWTVNWEDLASWISGKRRISLRYFKGTQSHTVQSHTVQSHSIAYLSTTLSLLQTKLCENLKGKIRLQHCNNMYCFLVFFYKQQTTFVLFFSLQSLA